MTRDALAKIQEDLEADFAEQEYRDLFGDNGWYQEDPWWPANQEEIPACYSGAMSSLPDLPVDMTRGDVRRTAAVPADYWNLVAQGYVVADGAAYAELSEDELTPQQKAARTRAARKAAADQEDSQEGPTDTAGDATGDES